MIRTPARSLPQGGTDEVRRAATAVAREGRVDPGAARRAERGQVVDTARLRTGTEGTELEGRPLPCGRAWGCGRSVRGLRRGDRRRRRPAGQAPAGQAPEGHPATRLPVACRGEARGREGPQA